MDYLFITLGSLTEDPAAKLGVSLYSSAIRDNTSNLITEIVGTFFLVFWYYGSFKY